MATWATLSDVRKERNVLFNDAVNTFYLQLYGVGERKPTAAYMGYSR